MEIGGNKLRKTFLISNIFETLLQKRTIFPTRSSGTDAYFEYEHDSSYYLN